MFWYSVSTSLSFFILNYKILENQEILHDRRKNNNSSRWKIFVIYFFFRSNAFLYIRREIKVNLFWKLLKLCFSVNYYFAYSHKVVAHVIISLIVNIKKATFFDTVCKKIGIEPRWLPISNYLVKKPMSLKKVLSFFH